VFNITRNQARLFFKNGTVPVLKAWHFCQLWYTLMYGTYTRTETGIGQ
jgi:hypothetical protein